MLSRVIIQNFKSIGEPGVDLELRPLTLLVGPNGGGKSSILDVVALASEQYSHSNLFEFNSHRSLLHGYDESSTCSIKLSLVINGNVSVHATEFDSMGRITRHSTGSDEGHFSQRFMSKVHLLRTTRGYIDYVAPANQVANVGTRGEHLLQLLAQIFGSRKFDDKRARIELWAQRFGMPNLRAGFWASSQVGGDFAEPELHNPVELAQASSGSRQILSLIVELFWAEPDHIILIEEPEISLHPQAQIDLMELFGEVIREDKQIIATTHSHYLLMAIGYGVQQGWINKDDVAVYHVVKKPETGTEASRLELGKDGYLKDWVPSYNEVERRLMQAWPKVPEEQT